jgi:phage gp16-like protein
MNPHAVIHVGLKQLGIEQEDARDLYERVTAKRSLKLMTSAEHEKVVGELRRLGFQPASKAARSGLQGKFAKQLQAYWIDLWNLGLVADRRDSALVAFVKRQTKVDNPKWVLDAATAAKAIEAMKAWAAREAGVDWSDGNHLPAYARQTGWRVAWAQWRMLAKARGETAEIPAFRAYATKISGRVVDAMTPRDWIGVMNALGTEVRKGKR